MIETSEFPVIPFEEAATGKEFLTGYDFLEENGAPAVKASPVAETEKQPEESLPQETSEPIDDSNVPEEAVLQSAVEEEDDIDLTPTVEIPANPSKDKIISCETVSSYIEKESLALYAVKQAEEKGVGMLVQYTPFTAQYPLDTLTNIKIFVISDEALFNLTGFFPDNTEKTLRALITLSEKIKSKYYIIQRGDDSVFIYDGKRYEIVFAPETMRKDTREIGAQMKPTFIGALAAEYLESKNIVRACHMATVVSLLTRSKFGNLEKLMTREELIKYATEHGIHLFK